MALLEFLKKLLNYCNYSLKIISTNLDKNWCKWAFSLFILSTACLTPIYTVPFFAASSNISNASHKINNNTKIIESFLDETLYDCFEDNINDFLLTFDWIKILFFVGFAVSQITVGFLGDYFGKWLVFKILIKILIIAGTLATLACKFFNVLKCYI